MPAAQNALLKTLEEPPSSSVFILVTARPDVLLPTVRSRCPRLRFRPLGARRHRRRRWSHAARPRAEARAIAATADGSLGRALEASAGDLRRGARRRRGGCWRTRRRRPIRGAASRARRICSPNTGGGGAADREQLASHLRAMASLLRDVELAGDAAPTPAAGQPRRPARARAADGAFQGERGIRAFAAVDQALAALERNAGVKIVADWLVLQL